MQDGDYSSVSYYHQYPPNPNPTPNYNPTPPPPTYASAPPFATTATPYSSSDYPSYPSTYPPYPQNPDPAPAPPTAPPSYSPIPPNPNPNNLHSFTPVQPSPPFPPYDQHAPYQQQQPPYFPPYDQRQTAPNYATSFPPNPSPSPYAHPSSSIPSVNNNSYENSSKFDAVGGYFDEPSSRYGGGCAAAGYGRSQSDLGPDLYGKRMESGGYGDRDGGGYGNGDGVYAYQGSNKVEPYGARGTGPKSSTWSSGFDDFGRPVGLSSGKGHQSSPAKVVRAVPKADTEQDVKSGVQKFRVKVLAESGGQSTMDVLCQVSKEILLVFVLHS